KELFKTGTYVTEGINVAARSSLNYGIRLHKAKKFELATNYYNRVINEPLVETLTFNKAESYYYLAKNNLGLTNLVIRKVNHDIKLNEFIDIQMTKKPQKWTKSGWINANKEDLLQYINPINSSATSISDMLYLLATGNTDPLQ